MRKKPYRQIYPNAVEIVRENKTVAFLRIKDGYALEIRDMKSNEKSSYEGRRHGMRIIQLLLSSETLLDLMDCMYETINRESNDP